MNKLHELSNRSSAWLLPVNNEMTIAIGDDIFSEYLVSPKLYPVPGSLPHCKSLIFWRGRFIPVMDILVLLGEKGLSSEHIAVIAYQEGGSKDVRHIALKMTTQTEKIVVDDNDAISNIPKNYPAVIRPLVTSLFAYEKRLISILNIPDLSNDGYRDFATQF